MPIATIQTPTDLLSRLTVPQLKERIRGLNSNGCAISRTGNKDLLIGRIIQAEHSGNTIALPTLPISTARAIDVQTALAKTVTVDSEPTKIYAAGILSSLGALAKEIVATFDPNKENWRAQVSLARKGLEDATALEAKFHDPVMEACKLIKDRIASFELEQHTEREKVRRQLERDTIDIAEEGLLNTIIELEDTGRFDEARQLEHMLDDGSIEDATVLAIQQVPVVAPNKAKGVSTRLVWQWEFLDSSKLISTYTEVTPNITLIDRVVKDNGSGACEQVGNGSIRVWQKAITRSTGR